MAVLNARRALALLVAAWLLAPGPAPAQTTAPDEYELMAVYAYNFAKFTEWPPGSFADAQASLNFCILGEDPFGLALAKVEGQKVRNHVLRIKRYPRVAVLSGCHIVFVSRSEDWRLERILQDLGTAPILTISDIPDFSQRGGMITLAKIDQRVRFAINPVIVADSGLKISSKLLELARIVSGA